MKTKTKYFIIFGLIGLVFLVCSSNVGVHSEEQLSATFYGIYGCTTCHEKYNIINNFVALHPEINFTSFWIGINLTSPEYYAALASLNETSPPPPPALVLNRSNAITIYYATDITTDNLEHWLSGEPIETEFTVWIAFVTGLITGISACMLLLLSVLGTSLTIVESRSKYLIISLGLIVGIVVAYLVISLLFLVVINALDIVMYLKYIFGTVLLVLGFWQVVEFKREKSIIFGTSTKVKSIWKDFIDRRSGIYALLVGLTFAFVKIPCFGAPYLQLLFVSLNDPILGLLILSYLGGLLIPICGVLVALRIGIQSERINRFRLNSRPYLRLLSGLLLITLTLYLFSDLFILIETTLWSLGFFIIFFSIGYLTISLDMILWIILAEFLTFVLIIWMNSRRNKQEVPEA